MTYKPGDILTAQDVNRYAEHARLMEQRRANPPDRTSEDTRFNVYCYLAAGHQTTINPYSIVCATNPTVNTDFFQVRLGTSQRDYLLNRHLVMDELAFFNGIHSQGRAGFTTQPIDIGIDPTALDADDNLLHPDWPHGINLANGYLVPGTGGYRVFNYKATDRGDGVKTVLAMQERIAQNFCAGNIPAVNPSTTVYSIIYNNSGSKTYFPPAFFSDSPMPFRTSGLFQIRGVVQLTKQHEAFLNESVNGLYIYSGDRRIYYRQFITSDVYNYFSPGDVSNTFFPFCNRIAKIDTVAYIEKDDVIKFKFIKEGAFFNSSLISIGGKLFLRQLTHTKNLF